MKAGWEIKKLGEVCQSINGLWKGEKAPLTTAGVIRNTNFTKDGALDDSDIAYLEVEVKKLAKRQLQAGDLILEKSGGGPKQPVGRVVIFEKTDGVFSFSNFTSALRINNRTKVEPRFLHKYLYWKYISGVTEGMQSHSTGIRNLDFDAYKEIPVPIPPLSEQAHIVGILDEAFASIATAKANTQINLENAKAVFESHLNSVFSQRGEGWVEKKLGEVCSEITVGHVGSMANQYKESGVYFLRSQNIRPFEVSLENVVFIDQAFHQSLRKSQLRAGDLAIVRTGYPGTAAVVPEYLTELNCSDLVIVRPTDSLNPYYLEGFFNSPYGKDLVLGKLVGAAQKHFNVTAAKGVRIYVPPNSHQMDVVKQIAIIREETSRLTSLYTQKLSALEDLKKSLLHQAFTGKL
jgi:type I restriction enzyme S subunit